MGENRKLFAAVIDKPVKHGQLLRQIGIALHIPEALQPNTKFQQSNYVKLPTHADLKTGVLVAEDNAINQKLLLKMLERLGYLADVASNGLEAVEAIERQTYDLVFMDVQMPELDGLEATKRILSMQQVHKPVIVAMTANVMAEDKQACFNAGLLDYLAKPARLEDVERILKQWLQPSTAMA